MKIKFSLLSSVVVILVNYSCASVELCFIRNGVNVNKSFDSPYVIYEAARKELNLADDEDFKDGNVFIDRQIENRMILQQDKCNVIVSQSAESSINICILKDLCKRIVLKNNEKVNSLRDKFLASLPKHYRDDQCADIVFLNNKGQEIQRSEEINVPFQNIAKNDKIEAYNKFIYNLTELDITWLLYSHRVRVNNKKSLRSLRYWITQPEACPNLKDMLNLPDKTLFPNPINNLAENWLSRDKRVDLKNVKSRNVVNTQLVAPYNHEDHLEINEYAYKTQESKIQRLYYVDVNEKDKIAFTGSRTDEFKDNYLTVKIESRSPKPKILLTLKDVRSTNNRAVAWTNVVISTNNTAVTFIVEWDNYKEGYSYLCKLFDYGQKHEIHKLAEFSNEGGRCIFNYIKDGTSMYDLLLSQQQLIENGEDLSKFRYELGVSVSPVRPNKWTWGYKRSKREAQFTGNTDIHQDQIKMGGAGKGDLKTQKFGMIFHWEDENYMEENKRLLYFNVFIFKSQEIAEKIIEDVATF